MKSFLCPQRPSSRAAAPDAVPRVGVRESQPSPSVLALSLAELMASCRLPLLHFVE